MIFSFPLASGYKIGPVCMCVYFSVSQLVSALTDEQIDVQTQKLVKWLTFMISRMSSKIKVSSSKKIIFEVLHGFPHADSLGKAMSCGITL